MDEDAKHSRRFRRGRLGCGSGCAGFLVVLTVGIALSLFHSDIGVGATIRIPFTQSNATVAASIGEKGKTTEALPAYARGRLGGNQDFINGSQTLTIGPAEGATLLILGRQDDAPAIDLRVVAR